MTKIFLEQGKRKGYIHSRQKYVKIVCFLPTRYNFISTQILIIIYVLNIFKLPLLVMLTLSKQQQKNKYVLIIQMTFTYEHLFIQFSMLRIA